MVMLLGGLWHGASWNFVAWGAIHGTMLGLERAHGKRSFYTRLPGFVKTIVTFLIVCIAWVFFRTDNIGRALLYCKTMFGMAPDVYNAKLLASIIYQPCYVIWMIVGAIVIWFAPQTWDYTKRLTPLKAVLIFVLFVFAMVMLSTQSFNPFIYFIF